MNSQTTAAQLVERTNIVIFTIRHCLFSKRLSAFMHNISSEVVEVEVDTIPDAARVQKDVMDRSGCLRFPQLFVKGKFIGGALDAEALSRTGELERLIR